MQAAKKRKQDADAKGEGQNEDDVKDDQNNKKEEAKGPPSGAEAELEKMRAAKAAKESAGMGGSSASGHNGPKTA